MASAWWPRLLWSWEGNSRVFRVRVQSTSLPPHPPTNSPPSSASSSCRWAGLNVWTPPAVSWSLHQGSLLACSAALWESRARAATRPEGLRKESASVVVTTERGGASEGAGHMSIK